MKKVLLLTCMIAIFNSSSAQEKLLDSLVSKNFLAFQPSKDNSFTGDGWNLLTKEINLANSVLLGESHFTNEIPYFTNALVNNFKFGSYFLEVDPYSTNFIHSKIKNLSASQLDEFVSQYSTNFSFLELKPEFELFKNVVNKDMKTFGIEQIYLDADQLILSDLLEKSKNPKTKRIFEEMLRNSKSLALENKEMKYLFSDDCLQKINQLLALKLTSAERKEIEDLKLSRDIYLNQNHPLRIQLMKHIILENFSTFRDQKKLFKFGAVHLPKGETLLASYDIYDIGSLMCNLEEADFKKSLHIMVVGKSEGEGDEDDLPKSFLKVMNNKDWFCFDLRPLRKAITKNKLKIEDTGLLRIIKGYDLLVYIPKLTESKKLSN